MPQQEGGERVLSVEVEEVVLAHDEGGLDYAVVEVEVAAVPPFGGHEPEVGLQLLHAHRMVL